jgi:hypothetical protein
MEQKLLAWWIVVQKCGVFMEYKPLQMKVLKYDARCGLIEKQSYLVRKNKRKKQKEMRIIIAIMFIVCICCCQNDTKQTKPKLIDHITYYEGTKNISYKYRTYNGKMIDTAFHYDTFGRISAMCIFFNDKVIEERLYRNGQIKFKIDRHGIITNYRESIKVCLINPKDSSYTYFYKDGGIRRFEKRCRGDVVYFNEYDSVTHIPVKFIETWKKILKWLMIP